jgi:hypothetical protein
MNPFDEALDRLPQAPGSRSIYDDAFDNLQQRSQGRVRQELQTTKSPEQRAEALRLSEFYQTPLEQVERDLDTYRLPESGGGAEVRNLRDEIPPHY